MAGDWIKVRCALREDPDVIAIAAAVGCDEFGAVGRLHAVWSWLDQHSVDGTNVRIVSAFLDRLTACPGFAAAMRAVGWLAGEDGALTFPGYLEHNGESAKRRATETKRKNLLRSSKRGRDTVRDTCPVGGGTNVRAEAGPEKRREEVQNISLSAGEGEEDGETRGRGDAESSRRGAEAQSQEGRTKRDAGTRGLGDSEKKAPGWMNADTTRAWKLWVDHIRALGVTPTPQTWAIWATQLQRLCASPGNQGAAVAAIEFSMSKQAKNLILEPMAREVTRAEGARRGDAGTGRRGEEAPERKEPRKINGQPSALFPDGAPAGVRTGEW